MKSLFMFLRGFQISILLVRLGYADSFMLIRCFPDRSIVLFVFESCTRRAMTPLLVLASEPSALGGKKAIGTTMEKATRRNGLFPLTAASYF